jgi:hypothetical protein
MFWNGKRKKLKDEEIDGTPEVKEEVKEEDKEEPIDRNILWLGDPEYRSNQHPLNIRTLESLGKNLQAGRKCMVNAWSNERIGPDYFRVWHVQELFNFSRQCIGALGMMKKKCVQGGIAYYDDEGKFKWVEEPEDES